MSKQSAQVKSEELIPEFDTIMGHPGPLWMLFMTEFWERFAFYGIRWALVLYIVAQFYGGDSAGEKPANELYGAYLALVYAAAIFGGYVADKMIGFQRSILAGAVIMAAGLFLLMSPTEEIFKLGLATLIIGNGLFKPIISTMVGKLYQRGDDRRDGGFTIFYMGINLGAMLAPIATGFIARTIAGENATPDYKYVFFSAGIGMVISLFWFMLGKAQLKGIGAPTPEQSSMAKTLGIVLAGLVIGIPVMYFLLTINATVLQYILMVLFIVPAVLLLVEGWSEGRPAFEQVIAMLIIFVFNVMFWMFFEQAGSSFTFLADKIVNRDFGSFEFKIEWFQSVNSIAIITLAPVMAWLWVRLGKFNPTVPRKFGLGLIFNGLAFLVLMYALSSLVNADGKIPFWTLFSVYVIQSVGELCLSPIGLSMTTKLAPARMGGLAMGCWFLSIAIGNNLSGIFAGIVSGESGMTPELANRGYTFGFWALLGAGLFLVLIAPVVNRLMHGVK